MIFGTLYAQLGIPSDAILLITLLAVVEDFFSTGANIAVQLLDLTRESAQLNLLGRTKLTA